MSIILCTEVTFVKKSSCLVARIVSIDTPVLHLHTFRILEPYSSKDIELDLCHVISHYGHYYSTPQLSLIWINAFKFPSSENMMVILWSHWDFQSHVVVDVWAAPDCFAWGLNSPVTNSEIKIKWNKLKSFANRMI